jgi:hypothetical protein
MGNHDSPSCSKKATPVAFFFLWPAIMENKLMAVAVRVLKIASGDFLPVL